MPCEFTTTTVRLTFSSLIRKHRASCGKRAVDCCARRENARSISSPRKKFHCCPCVPRKYKSTLRTELHYAPKWLLSASSSSCLISSGDLACFKNRQKESFRNC